MITAHEEHLVANAESAMLIHILNQLRFEQLSDKSRLMQDKIDLVEEELKFREIDILQFIPQDPRYVHKEASVEDLIKELVS